MRYHGKRRSATEEMTNFGEKQVQAQVDDSNKDHSTKKEEELVGGTQLGKCSPFLCLFLWGHTLSYFLLLVPVRRVLMKTQTKKQDGALEKMKRSHNQKKKKNKSDFF